MVGLARGRLYPESVAGVMLSDSFFPGLRHVEPNFGRPNVWVDLRETFRQGRRGTRRNGGLRPPLPRCRGTRRRASEDARSDWSAPFGRGWLRQLPRLAETTCGDEVLAEAGLTAERIAAVARPVVALYDEFSPFLATCRWLEENLQRLHGRDHPGGEAPGRGRKHRGVHRRRAAAPEATWPAWRARHRPMYFATFILKNLTRRPTRTALTVLGLAVAVGSMIALLGISHNVEAGRPSVRAPRRRPRRHAGRPAEPDSTATSTNTSSNKAQEISGRRRCGHRRIVSLIDVTRDERVRRDQRS